MGAKRRMRVSAGFSVIELIVAMVLFAIAASVAVPSVSEAARIARIDRASRSIAVDLEKALGLAARQRSPVRIAQPAGTRSMVVSSVADGTVYSTTDLGDDTRTEVRVGTLTLNPATVDIAPTGMASAALTVTLQSGVRQRTITMSQAGEIRVF